MSVKTTANDADRPAPTMRDVAKLAGVSVASVSNYLSDYPYMKPATRERIKQAIDMLGYVTNNQARSLRSGRTGLISLSIPSLNQTYFAELAEHVIAAARRRGYSVTVESTALSRRHELESVAAMARKMSDGLILSPLLMENRDVERLGGDYPLVVLGERLFDVPAPHILVHNIDAARALTQHLIDAGCRRIALIGGTLDRRRASAETLRTQGYFEALDKAGMPMDVGLIRPILAGDDDGKGDVGGEGNTDTASGATNAREGAWPGLATSRNGSDAVRRMFEEGVRPDAILCYNDLIAFGVLHQLREMRVRIPEDVRVVSMDNLDEAQYTIPSLTSVELGKAQIAQQAVEAILNQVERGGRGVAEQQYVDFSIQYRESSPAVA